MISAIAIIFGTLVAFNTCSDDISDIRKGLGEWSGALLHAVTVCMQTPAKCAAEIPRMKQCMGPLRKLTRNALTDCDGQSSACTGDIKNIDSTLEDATKNLIDLGRGHCSHRGSKCAHDMMKITKDIESSFRIITNATKDCSSNQLLAPSITALLASSNTADCVDDIETVSADLTGFARDVITTITDCSKDEVKCAKEVSDIAKQIGATTVVVNKAVTDCLGVTFGCADDIMWLTEDLRSDTTAMARAAKNCAEDLGTRCKSEIIDAASALFSASADIMKVRSDCDIRMRNKIAA